jgi:hypothetical protein
LWAETRADVIMRGFLHGDAREHYKPTTRGTSLPARQLASCLLLTAHTPATLPVARHSPGALARTNGDQMLSP